uniref:FRIGIDA-like protein n=1 Tax=Dimocarpus longan TaxID=128017 RepID=A0A088QDB2_9ROSI|nr:FRIGIDA [Dimocarpus longan]
MAQSEEPPFMKFLNEIGGFCTAYQSFKHIFDDLLKHIDSTRKAIDTQFNNLPSSQQQQQQQLLLQTDLQDMQLPIVSATVPETQRPTTKPSRVSEFHDLCKTMCSRGLRKFLVSHLSDADGLRREAASALKSAPEPAKLVLECVGRFFLQGSKAYTKDSPMITSREASVLILELFLILIGASEVEIVIEDSIKKDASAASAAWRNRIQSEGGPSKVCEIDARGLLLFIACFGIPDVFKDEDIRDLIIVSNISQIAHLLKHSPMLAPKIPDIIGNMKKNGMLVEAVDVVYTFGIEDKFSPQTILTAFIQESKEAWNRSRRNPPLMQKKACKKHLAALKSVIRCLENRNIDPVKLLPEFEIKENIVKLEKEIANLNKQITDSSKALKRKAVGIESSNKFNSQEAKRSRFTPKESFLMTSPSIIGLNDARAANYAVGKSSYDGLMPNLLDLGASSHVQSYPAASAAILGYGARTSLDVLGTAFGGGGSVPGVGVDVSESTGVGILPTGSFSGVRRDLALDNVGQPVYGNDLAYRWNRLGETAYGDRFTTQSILGNPAVSKVDALLRQSLSIDRVAGQPEPQSIGVSNRSSSSDLYGFADAVV